MLPVPTRDASPTANAWKEEIPPSDPVREPSIVRSICGNIRTWTNLVRTVNHSPAPMSR